MVNFLNMSDSEWKKFDRMWREGKNVREISEILEKERRMTKRRITIVIQNGKVYEGEDVALLTFSDGQKAFWGDFKEKEDFSKPDSLEGFLEGMRDAAKRED